MQFQILILDLKSLLSEFRLQDMGPLIFWVFWLIALLASLRGVDRRDEIAQITYVGALLAVGTVLILLLPLRQHQNRSVVEKIVVLAILMLVPSLRWIYEGRNSAFEKIMQKVSLAEKGVKKGEK